MKRKIMAPMLAAALLLSNGITAFAAPEVINVGGVNTVFDAEYYAAANPDVAAALGTGRDALVQHYTLCGKAENRPAYAPGTDVDALLSAVPAPAPVQKKKIKSKTEIDILEETQTNYEYDEHGNVLSRSRVSGPARYTETYTYSYTYDEYGNVLSEIETTPSGSSRVYTYTYTYDEQGNILSQADTIPGYPGSPGYTSTSTYAYDTQGNILSRSEARTYSDTIYTYDYTYDEQGNILSEIKTSPSGSTTTYAYTYDEYGNVLSEAYIGPLMRSTVTCAYTYDEYGNPLSETRTSTASWVATRSYTYSYIYF